MMTALHVSCAVASPVLLAFVLAGHSSVTFGGSVSVGGVISRTVIVCTALVLLPHVSVAVQVRAITRVPPQLLVTESAKLTITLPQSSTAVAAPVTLVEVLAGQSSTLSAGMVRIGATVSTTRTSLEQ